MAFARTGIAAGQTAQASQLLQLIQCLEGDSGSGQPIALTALSSASAYALDVRNLSSGGALRVRDTTGNQSLAFADQTLTYALGAITSDGGLRLTATWNAGGVTFTGLKVTITDTSSASASLLADFVVGASSLAQISKTGCLLATGASASALALAGTGDSNTGLFFAGSDVLGVATGGTERLRIGAGGSVLVGTTTANSSQTVGITIDQSTNDDHILTLQSSTDVAHGVTDLAPTNTFGYWTKANATAGGLTTVGIGETTIGLRLQGVATNDDTTKTVVGVAPIDLLASKKSGTGVGTNGADANLVVIRDGGGSTQFIFDVEGSAHANVEWTTFATEDDLALVADIEAALLEREAAPGAAERRRALEATGVINRDSWYLGGGRPRAMVNFTRLAMLHHGALIQVAERFAALERRVAALPAAGPAAPDGPKEEEE